TVALRTGLMEYDRRHRYRGATAKVDLTRNTTAAELDGQLEEFPVIGGLRPAIVEKVEARSAKIYVKDLGLVELPWEKLSWARRELPDEKVDRAPTQASEILSPGDVIYTVGRSAESLMFVQVPEAQSALVSVDPKDGAVVALVGGFDFFQSKYNRVTQARRQPGSGFKPFVYAAAFDKGFTPASVVLDAPVVIDEQGNEKSWRPHEDTDKFYGPVRLREALVHSQNLVSVRLMRAIGLDYAWNYVTRFGFDKSQLPDDLTLALGTAELSPLQVAIGYSTFANGGFKVSSYYIDRVEDAAGKVLQQADPAIACPQCGRVSAPSQARVERGRAGLEDEAAHDGKTLIPPKNLAPQIIKPQIAYLLADMMADVIKRGTGQRARTLNRDDIAGKTGTSNDFHDAWFNGFNGDIVTTVWTGFDADRSLGGFDDQAARVAVPTWTYFMHEALAGTARHPVPIPEGIVSVRISPQTGLLASSDNPNGIMEKFMEGNLPKSEVYEGSNTNPDADKPLF
ncbi:MAG TPA: penicillin-binding transpeptidase domain-containing protein, partial [Steroidobacteraceae bacterium]|nr:penicillin-binding transpeptidase domain-containing protein [Steroidobacteraceae bacterium]